MKKILVQIEGDVDINTIKKIKEDFTNNERLEEIDKLISDYVDLRATEIYLCLDKQDYTFYDAIRFIQTKEYRSIVNEIDENVNDYHIKLRLEVIK